MMKGKNLSNAFWVEAIIATVYLKNRSPTRCLDNITPFEALYGSKLAVHNLKIFGCKDFAHVPKENRKKLDAKAIKCIFIGYCHIPQFCKIMLFVLISFLRHYVKFNAK